MQNMFVTLAVVLILGYIVFDWYRVSPGRSPTKKSPSALEVEMQRYREHQAALAAVIQWACDNGGLTKFPRIVHYLGKENGGSGWEDSYQNILTDQAINSYFFQKITDGVFHCNKDDSEWQLISYEWRMGAEKKRLINIRKKHAVDTLGLPFEELIFFSNDFYRTDGFEPADTKQVSLNDVCNYLTALPDGVESCQSFEVNLT